MSRPGYSEAKLAKIKAFDRLTEAQAQFIAIDSKEVSEAHKEIFRKDARHALKLAQENMDQAQAAFDVFNRPKRAARHYYEARLPMLLSLDKALLAGMNQRCDQDDIPKTELVRRALQAYLNPPIG